MAHEIGDLPEVAEAGKDMPYYEVSGLVINQDEELLT